MGKKKNFHRTVDESKIHEKAVKMRKMTDEQLVHYVEDRVAKAKSEGINLGKASAASKRGVDIKAIMSEIGNVKGIGTSKLQFIHSILEAHLEVGNA